jgi:hypothetical protein
MLSKNRQNAAPLYLTDIQYIRKAVLCVEKSGTFLGENPCFSRSKVALFEEKSRGFLFETFWLKNVTILKWFCKADFYKN